MCQTRTQNFNKEDFTNLILDGELIDLALNQIVTAHDPNSPFYLSKLHSYELYHEPLQNYFIKKYNKKTLEKTDNLAFILLLSYPDYMIRSFKNFKDIKLGFHNRTEESDFDSIGSDIDDSWTSTCICNQRIKTIHTFRNKYSGLSFQIGSDCYTRSGLISKNDPNYKTSYIKKKEAKERKREKEEGKPEGYYENERKKLKEDKLIEKERKILEKELKKLNKKTPEFKMDSCLFCNKFSIYNSYKSKLCICSTCIPEKYKKIKVELISNINSKASHLIQKTNIYCIDNCCYCEKVFVSIDKKELCNVCIKYWKIKNCKYRNCNVIFCLDIDEDDDYCPNCEEKIIKCTNCSINIYKETANHQYGRCNDCHRRFLENKILKECQYCKENFEVYEKDKWRTCCNTCYKVNIIEKKCPICPNTFKLFRNEIWRKTCTKCYYKSLSDY